MSWGVNLDDLAAARDELLADVEERPRSHALERLARAHRWLGEEDAARRRFREAAGAAEAVLERWRRDDPSAVSRVGSLLVRARDPSAAAPWLARADESVRRPDDRAAVAYLRGDFAGALESARRAADEDGFDGGYPWADAVAAIAGARAEGDAELAGDALARFAALIREERIPLDEESGSGGLSLFDWLEESARARAELSGDPPPAGSELLDAVGLLRAERAPVRAEPPPDAGPTTPGSTTIAYPGPDGGELKPSVTVDDDLDIHFLLDPARNLRASLVQREGGWRARLGDAELPGRFRGPRGAKRAIWDPLREEPNGQWAVALLDRLFRESFRF